jgi:phosphoglucosamine mutase
VLIGKDTRISGYMLESALESGFNSAGVDVVLLGPVPTPAVAYLTRAQRAALGVVISASHNPYPDNGIKFFSARGTKLPDDWERRSRPRCKSRPQWVDSPPPGQARAGWTMRLAATSSSARAASPADLSLKGLKIVVDAPMARPTTSRPRCSTNWAPRWCHRLRARRPEHQPRRRRHPPRGAGARPSAHTAPTTALRWTATPTGCSWSTPAGRLFNGDELLYLMAGRDRLRGARDEPMCPAWSAR